MEETGRKENKEEKAKEKERKKGADSCLSHLVKFGVTEPFDQINGITLKSQVRSISSLVCALNTSNHLLYSVKG